MRVHLHRSARQQPIQLKASSATAVRQPVIPFQMHCVHHRKHVIVDVSSSSSGGGGTVAQCSRRSPGRARLSRHLAVGDTAISIA